MINICSKYGFDILIVFGSYGGHRGHKTYDGWGTTTYRRRTTPTCIHLVQRCQMALWYSTNCYWLYIKFQFWQISTWVVVRGTLRFDYRISIWDVVKWIFDSRISICETIRLTFDIQIFPYSTLLGLMLYIWMSYVPMQDDILILDIHLGGSCMDFKHSKSNILLGD